MEVLVVLGVIVVAAATLNSAFKAGKREGSRKGYGVGFDRGRRNRNSSGCLLALVALGLELALAGAAVACWL